MMAPKVVAGRPDVKVKFLNDVFDCPAEVLPGVARVALETFRNKNGCLLSQISGTGWRMTTASPNLIAISCPTAQAR
jgi:hypothetical protein